MHIMLLSVIRIMINGVHFGSTRFVPRPFASMRNAESGLRAPRWSRLPFDAACLVNQRLCIEGLGPVASSSITGWALAAPILRGARAHLLDERRMHAHVDNVVAEEELQVCLAKWERRGIYLRYGDELPSDSYESDGSSVDDSPRPLVTATLISLLH